MDTQEFFQRYHERILRCAQAAGWLPRPGSSLELDIFLLPDGPGCPEDDAGIAYEEALRIREAELDLTDE